MRASRLHARSPCPCSALYPISVRRLADSLAASFSRPLTLAALRFAWVATTSSPEDFHLQVTIHAGHTKRNAPTWIGAFLRSVEPAGVEPASVNRSGSASTCVFRSSLSRPFVGQADRLSGTSHEVLVRVVVTPNTHQPDSDDAFSRTSRQGTEEDG